MPSDIFPRIHCCSRLLHVPQSSSLFDVQFYPYPTEDDDQVFATVAAGDVIVCRPVLNGEQPFEVLQWMKDEDTSPDAFGMHCLEWAKDPITERPLLCVSGSSPRQIRILDIETGKLVRTLVGHGKDINDLAISPLSSNILASASTDYTIRLWDLHPKHERQPCRAIFSGQGHREAILAARFHPNGKWLISGGNDTAVCLWAVPTLEELENRTDPMFIHYPLFYSKEVHHHFVDSMAFYGDLILSHCSKEYEMKKKSDPNSILLWRIEGFDADGAAPTQPPIPQLDVNTRSAFPHGGRSAFQRLLTFSMPDTSRFYHRFNLLQAPGMRPILCMGNEKSKLCFWDLQKLEEGIDSAEDGKKKGGDRRKSASKASNGLQTKDSTPRLQDDETSTVHSAALTSSSAPSERRSVLGDPFASIAPHYTFTPHSTLPSLQKNHFATSQLAWSPDGTWLVGVGDSGVMCIFHRDKSVLNGVQGTTR